MSLSAASSWGTEPTNPTTLATMNAFIKSQTIVLSGTVGASDIASAAITSTKVAPEAFLYSGSSYSGGVFTISTANSGSTSFENGLRVVFKASAAATTNDQVNVNSQGTKKLYRMGGTVRVKGGDFRANTLVEIGYNTSLDASAGGWEILSVLALPDVRYESTTTTGTNDYVATFAPTVPALVDGTRCTFKVPNTNTGACTFAPDGLTAKAIKKNYSTALAGGELWAGAVAELVYDATNDWWQLLSNTREVPSAAIQGATKNLVMVASSTVRVTATADEVVVKNTTGEAYLISSLSSYADLTNPNGANGLDTGAEASSTWYYIWAIYNPTGGSAALMLSASGTAPTMPSGYTFKALLGEVYNDSASDFRDFTQHQDEVRIKQYEVYAGAGAVVVQSISLSACVPPTASRARGYVGTTNNADCQVVMGVLTNGIQQLIQINTTGATWNTGYGTYAAGGPFDVLLGTAQLTTWLSASAAANYGISVTGYKRF